MKRESSKGATLIAVSVAHFLMPFMMSGVGVALPTIGMDLDASAKQLGLVETTYVLSASIFLLAMGRLGDIYGRRRIFQYGIALFTFVGGLLSQAWSIESVIALRFLQGMGGSMVIATGTAIIVSVFPTEERGKALGITAASIYAGISCGPFIGGALVSAFGWRSIFYLCVPLGISTYLFVLWRLKGEWAESRGEPFDWRGSLVYAVSVILLVSGASHLDQPGLWAKGLILAGLAAGALFFFIEARSEHPVLKVSMFRRNRVFAFGNLATLLNYAATFGVTFFMSLYLQYVQGLTPRHAGAVLMIQPVVQTLLSPLCGRLSDRYPAERVATIGMALCAAGLGGAVAIGADTPLTVIAIILVSLGVGFALFSAPNVSVIMGSVPPKHLGIASGLVATMRTLGMMTSMTVVTIMFSLTMGEHAISPETQEGFLTAMQRSMLTFCVLCGAGIFCSMRRWSPRAKDRATPLKST